MNETPPRIRRDVSNLPRPSTRIEAYSHNAPGEHSPTGWMKVRLDRQIARPPCRLPTLPIAQSILLRNPPLPPARAALPIAQSIPRHHSLCANFAHHTWKLTKHTDSHGGNGAQATRTSTKAGDETTGYDVARSRNAAQSVTSHRPMTPSSPATSCRLTT